MADTLWMAVVVTLLATNDPSAPPTIRVSPQEFASMEDCDKWKAGMDAQAPQLVDRPSGKLIIANFNHCTPVRADSMAEDLTAAIKKYQ